MFEHIKGSRSSNPVLRFFRSALSIVIISAFVIGVTLLIREISTLNSSKVSDLVSSIASKVGLPEDKVGKVAGAVTERILDTSITAPAETTIIKIENEESKSEQLPKLLEVAFLADIHDDLASLSKAIYQIKQEGITHVIVLGDLTDFGTIEALTEVKKILDESGLTYFVIPGDHDLYKSVGPENFISVFGVPTKAVSMQGTNFFLLDNSANFTLITDENVSLFKQKLTVTDFVILAQPIYVKSLSVLTPMMGYVNGDEDVAVNNQRKEILELVRSSKVKAVVAGDHHRSGQTVDEVNSDISHFVVGAVNPSKRLQSARFSVMDIFEDGSYNMREVLLEEDN